MPEKLQISTQMGTKGKTAWMNVPDGENTTDEQRAKRLADVRVSHGLSMRLHTGWGGVGEGRWTRCERAVREADALENRRERDRWARISCIGSRGSSR